MGPLIGLLEGLSAAMLLPVLQTILGSFTLNFPGNAWILRLLSRSSINVDPLVLFGIGFIFTTLLRNAIEVLNDYEIVATSARVMSDFRLQVYRTYADATYDFLVDSKAGELSYNSHIPAKAVAKLLSTAPKLMKELFRALGLIIVIVLASPKMALVLLILLTFFYFQVTKLIGRKIYSVGLVSRDANTKLSGLLNEFFGGIRQILIGNAKPVWFERLDSVNETLRQAYIREVFWPGMPNNVIEALGLTTVFGLVVVMKLALTQPAFQTNISFLGVIAFAIYRLLPTYATLYRFPIDITNAMPELERLYGILHQDVPLSQNGTKRIMSFAQEIVFDKVTFAYPKRQPLFCDLNLKFSRGRYYAIVGPTGGGKTTLLNLILGLYTPKNGKILVDGLDLRDIDLMSWYQQVGFVSQQVFIFHASVFDNIRLFNSSYDLPEIKEVAKLSLAHEFIMELPQGYQTIVGERGMRLSGGQQQRLALARALLHNPKVLLLDEATSALDTVSERIVQQAIYAASKSRMVVAIAHRLSTIMNADNILVIENGQVVEEGIHADLIKRGGVYTRLAQMQASEKKFSGTTS